MGVELHAVFWVATPAVGYSNGSPADTLLLLLVCNMPLSGSSSSSYMLSLLL
jgi:hypothetical protein